jgi:hypothetical protein
MLAWFCRLYQGEDPAMAGAIVATAQSTTVGGVASSMILLPDGTRMTLVGVTALTSAIFRP